MASLTNDLVLNTGKTKELILDLRKWAQTLQPLNVNGSEVKWVDSFNLLGFHISRNRMWSSNTLCHYPSWLLTQAYRGLVETIKTAERITGPSPPSIQTLYSACCQEKAQAIPKDQLNQRSLRPQSMNTPNQNQQLPNWLQRIWRPLWNTPTSFPLSHTPYLDCLFLLFITYM